MPRWFISRGGSGGMGPVHYAVVRIVTVRTEGHVVGLDLPMVVARHGIVGIVERGVMVVNSRIRESDLLSLPPDPSIVKRGRIGAGVEALYGPARDVVVRKRGSLAFDPQD